MFPPLTTCLLYIVIAEAIWWVLLKLRLPPTILMRANFALTFLFALIGINWTGFFIHNSRLLGVHPNTTSRHVTRSVVYFMKLLIFLNPQITIHHNEAAQSVISDVSKVRTPSVFACNHASMAESQTLFALTTADLCQNSRGLYKSTLKDIALWGAYYTRSQSFPVYFKDSEGESFSVDKEKQAKVTADMVRFLTKENGILSIFPEGQINRGDPTIVQPLRHGMLRLTIEHGLPMYICIQHGTWVTWPREAALGGFPADIYYDLMLLELPPAMKQHVGTPAADIPLEVVEKFAEVVRGTMQRMMDGLKKSGKVSSSGAAKHHQKSK